MVEAALHWACLKLGTGLVNMVLGFGKALVRSSSVDCSTLRLSSNAGQHGSIAN
jgi:hypothetical protein